MQSNEIVSIPDFLTKLPNLEYLDLRNNLLETLPDNIDNIKSLKFLKLSGNFLYIDEIPEYMKKKTSDMKLIGCKIEVLEEF